VAAWIAIRPGHCLARRISRASYRAASWAGAAPGPRDYARNLTPDLETGLGYYKEKEIILALRSGKRLDGKPMLPPMPWQNIPTLSEADMHALVAYLQSIPPDLGLARAPSRIVGATLARSSFRSPRSQAV